MADPSKGIFGAMGAIGTAFQSAAIVETSDAERLAELEKTLVEYDYEARAATPMVSEAETASTLELLHYPEDDVEVEAVAPSWRTATPGVPPLEAFVRASLDPYVQESLAVFEDDRLIAERNYRAHGVGRPPFPDVSVVGEGLRVQEFEVDLLEDLKKRKRQMQALQDAGVGMGGTSTSGGDGDADPPPVTDAHGHATVIGMFDDPSAGSGGNGKAGQPAASSDSSTDSDASGHGGAATEGDEADPLHLDKVGPLNKALVAEVAALREGDRVPLLTTMSDATVRANPPASDERRLGSEVNTRRLTQVELRFKEFIFDFPEMEAFFLQVTLYDVQEGVRISEDFHTGINSAYTLELLKDHLAEAPDPETCARRAVFTFRKPSQALWVMVRVFKVLQGDNEEAADPYIKFPNIKDKVRFNVQETVRDACIRHGQYRQSFAWTAFPLYLPDMSLRTKAADGSVVSDRVFTDFYRMSKNDIGEDRVPDLIADLAEGTLKRKVLNGRLVVSFKRAKQRTYNPPGRLTPSLQPVPPMLGDEAGAAAAVVAAASADQARRRMTVDDETHGSDGSDSEDSWMDASVADMSAASTSAGGAATNDPTDIMTRDPMLIKEIQYFPPTPNADPFASYVNNLYVYPMGVDLSSRKGSFKARNIAVSVSLMATDELQARPLTAVYGQQYSYTLVDKVITPVWYHNKTPTWAAEVKVAVPAQLSASHHLLFTFYHVVLQASKAKKLTNARQIAGYAVLPLMDGGHVLADDVHALPVYKELGHSYLAQPNEEAAIDHAKPVFAVQTRLVSSLYTQDAILAQLFAAFAVRNEQPQTLISALANFPSASATSVVRFSNVLITQLLVLVCSGEAVASALAFERVLNTFRIVAGESRADGHRVVLIRAYVNHRFRNAKVTRHIGGDGNGDGNGDGQGDGEPAVLVFEKVAEAWLRFLDVDHSAGGDRERPTAGRRGTLRGRSPSTNNHNQQAWEIGLSYSGELFDLVVKSMTEHLWERGLLRPPTDGTQLPPRRTWFSDSFYDTITRLLVVIHEKLRVLSVTGVVLAHETNRNVGLFLRDLFSLMDRGFVFGLVERYARSFLPTASEGVLSNKFAFLRVVCDYEHFVPLNLPLAVEYNNPPLMCDEMRVSHFLVGLLLAEVDGALGHMQKPFRQAGVTTVRDLLFKLSNDGRFAAPAQQQRIVDMFFPLLRIVSGHTLDIARMKTVEKRGLLVLFMDLLHGCSPEMTRNWWRRETEEGLIDFFEVVLHAVETFQYVGRQEMAVRQAEAEVENESRSRKQQLESMYTASGMSDRRRSLRIQSGPPEDDGEDDGDGAKTRPQNRRFRRTLQRSDFNKSMKKNQFRKIDPLTHKLETNLCTEVTLIVLDTVDSFCELFGERLDEDGGVNPLMAMVVRVLAAVLDHHLSTRAMRATFGFLRCFVQRFSSAIFQSSTTYCGDLCDRVLHFCNSTLEVVRVEASALMYLMMKVNFNFRPTLPDFSRMKLQTTIALSRLVGEELETDAYLRRSLATVVRYAAEDRRGAIGSSFTQQVNELMARLFDILSDSVKLQANRDDPEMQADLVFRIAAGYMNAPNLRLTWLGALLRFHHDQGNVVEEAMCQVHIAALVSEFLCIREPVRDFPQGATAFSKVSLNVQEETAISDAVMHSEGVCEGDPFSAPGLVSLLTDSIRSLTQSTLWESAIDVYKLVLPIYEGNREYEALAEAHSQMEDLYSKIIESIKRENRILGTFYRVALYGPGFGELDGAEFIYKEVSLTKLPEITARLRDLYSSRFGAEALEIIRDSSDVDRADLDPNVNYVQVTSVDPFFEPWELKSERVTYFERNTNLTRFMFETPFTSTGKSHGDLSDQHKRKTILTCARPFPYMLKRINVVSREVITLSPIEAATEEIESRVEKLRAEVRRTPTNIKTLQIVLAGSVQLQVNAGPMAICQTFLGNEKEYPSHLVARLRASFKDFVAVCERALQINKGLIGEDQYSYQQSLELGYKDTQDQLRPFLYPREFRKEQEQLQARSAAGLSGTTAGVGASAGGVGGSPSASGTTTPAQHGSVSFSDSDDDGVARSESAVNPTITTEVDSLTSDSST